MRREWLALIGIGIWLWGGGAGDWIEPAQAAPAAQKAASKTEKKASEKKAPAAQKESQKKAQEKKAQASQKKATPAPKKLKPLLTPKDRKVNLRGTRNTRQLGGLPSTRDGLYTKQAAIYRSGALCFLKDSDVDILKEKGIRTVIELRTPQEIARDGRDVPAFVSSLDKIYNLPLICTSGRGASAYASYLKANNHRNIAQFFHILSQEKNYPLLFHCSAGKDRAGIMSALLLELLGVPRPIIMDDYLTSQRNSLRLKVEADWLRVVFRTVDKAGGIEAFLQQCGVKPQEMQAIRQLLLVPKAK